MSSGECYSGCALQLDEGERGAFISYALRALPCISARHAGTESFVASAGDSPK